MQNEIKKRRYFRRKKQRQGNEEINPRTYILPSLFTTGNLFSGFFGIVKAINGDFQAAAIAVLVSWVFDILDGKVARLTRSTSRFGVEYDSLTDLVAFGVGPGLLMYLWALRPFGRFGWLAAFVFVACGALRLARFNVQAETSGTKKYFVGLPIPGAASMVAASVLFLSQWSGFTPAAFGLPLLIVTYILGFLMVSNIPYNSYKDMEVVKEKPMTVLLIMVVLVTIVAARPQVMFFSLMLMYVLSGPVTYLIRQARKSRSPAKEEAQQPSGEAGEPGAMKEDSGLRH